MKLLEAQGENERGEDISVVICENNSFEFLKHLALKKCDERGIKDPVWITTPSFKSWAQLFSGDEILYFTRP